MSDRELAEELNRTRSAVAGKRRGMGIHKKQGKHYEKEDKNV